MYPTLFMPKKIFLMIVSLVTMLLNSGALFAQIGNSENVPRELQAPSDINLRHFGVSICGNQKLVVVGAPEARAQSGSALIYEPSEMGWARIKELKSDVSQSMQVGPSFGSACALSPTFLAVSAPSEARVLIFKNQSPFPYEYEIKRPEGITGELWLEGNMLWVALPNSRNAIYQLSPTEAQELEISNRSLPATGSCNKPDANKFGLQGNFNDVCFENDAWQIASLSTIFNTVPIQRVYAIPVQRDFDFLSESEAEDQIVKACGPADSQSVDCIEATLHQLWEQHRVLYSVYDSVLKNSVVKISTHPVVNAGQLDQHHIPSGSTRLFDKFLEQTKLERLISKECGNMVSARFAKVAQQLDQEDPQKIKLHTEQESSAQHRMQQLQAQLKDLLDKNPDLPLSPQLEPSLADCGGLGALAAVGQQTPATQKFKTVAASIGEESPNSASSSPVPSESATDKSFYESIKDFLGFESEKRQAGIAATRSMSEIQKRSFEIVAKILDPATSESEQAALQKENEQLQKELVSIAEGMHEKYGK